MPTRYRERVMGCWLGKAVGGTLGQTFEGLEGPLRAEFYHPVPQEMVPNDDLDLQIVHAHTLRSLPIPRVDRHQLAEGWLRHVDFPWNEYGVGLRNLREGIRPPYTGSFDNWFTCGEGAAIRSELWACLAAGDPDRAMRYAYEDACFDHDGDGIVAAQFLARLQAAAFVENDPHRLIDIALTSLPEKSRLVSAVRDTVRWVHEAQAECAAAEQGERGGESAVGDVVTGAASGKAEKWMEVRQRLVDTYACDDFTDVRVNTAFVILGWLMGTNFAQRILITNNCGSDCDSTTASLGALLGILDPDSIPGSWLEPIGNSIVLSPEIHGFEPPKTLEEFTDHVVELSEALRSDIPLAEADEAPENEFSPENFRIPVRMGYTNTCFGNWQVRDLTELPPVGTPAPDIDLEATELPGTWMRIPRDEFCDRILWVEYSLNTYGQDDIRIMCNSTEPYRLWIDGQALHAAQGSNYQFPAPHMPPVGQYVDLTLGTGTHTLLLALKKPPRHRTVAEWVIAVTDQRTFQWIPHALRPGRANA